MYCCTFVYYCIDVRVMMVRSFHSLHSRRSWKRKSLVRCNSTVIAPLAAACAYARVMFAELAGLVFTNLRLQACGSNAGLRELKKSLRLRGGSEWQT